MKNTIKILGVIAVIAVTGFTMTFCGGNGESGNGEKCEFCEENPCICQIEQGGLIFSLLNSPQGTAVYEVSAGNNVPAVVVIPASVNGMAVEAILREGFAGLSHITGITIPASVHTIGINAFRGCTSITNITIPSSVTNMGTGVFMSWTSVMTQTIDIPFATLEQAENAWGGGWRVGFDADIRNNAGSIIYQRCSDCGNNALECGCGAE